MCSPCSQAPTQLSVARSWVGSLGTRLRKVAFFIDRNQDHKLLGYL